jgi:alanyl aminopeptidase
LVSLSVELACREGDPALFEVCKTRFEQSHTPAERDDFLTAIASFRDPAIQEQALQYSLSGPLRPQEMFDIPLGIASNSEAQTEQIFTWLIDNYDVISQKLPPMSRSFLPMMAGGCSLERLARAQEFFLEPTHVLPGVEARLARISDSVHDCVGLREREGAKVAAYLAGVSAAGAVDSGAGGSQPGR